MHVVLLISCRAIGLDGTRSPLMLDVRNIVNMVAKRDEKIKEQFAPHLHLHLHGAATLKCLPAADNKC